MGKRVIACGIGVACALALLAPPEVSARSSFARGGLRGPHGHGHWPYGYGPVATYAPAEYAAPIIVAPAAYPASAAAPRCVHSRETVTVPAEAGGERQVTITRC